MDDKGIIRLYFDRNERAIDETAKKYGKYCFSISQESRLIFMRRYWFCDSIAEIAHRYGISESKVKMRLHRTRNQLAEYLNKEGISV